jgi:quinol monooxygenase YgiN
MKTPTVWFTVEFAIEEGKLDAFDTIATAMAAGSAQEPGTLAYEFCLSSDRTRCRLVEMYAGPDAVLAHLTGPVVQDLVPRALAVATISSLEVYGDPGPKAAEMLAAAGAQFFGRWRGFTR